MSEARWLQSKLPEKLLPILERNVRNVSERKLRLFACACCAQQWSYFKDAQDRAAVEIAERYADGQATLSELLNACVLAIGRHTTASRAAASAADAAQNAVWAASGASRGCSWLARGAIASERMATKAEQAALAGHSDLLRDVF